nr:hypothetical protein [uncultured Psychroserpens sp.]
MNETKTESELKSLCKEIVEYHQKEFEEILNGKDSEYDSFMKYSDLTSKLQNTLELAVNHFNPQISNLLQLQYLRLTQYSVGLQHYLDFTKKNNVIFNQKFINPENEQ